MNTSPAVPRAGSTTTTFGGPPQGRASRRARARRVHTPLWWRHACGIAAWCSMMVVMALWITGGGPYELVRVGPGLSSIGRLTGLLASDLLLVQVLLMARIPAVERSFGQDALVRSHQVGFWSFILMAAHIVAISLGYAATTSTGLWHTVVDLVINYPGMLLAVAGTFALVGVTITSVRSSRRRLRYESWHLLHLYAYLGLGLALPHQLWTGRDFLTSSVSTVFWWTLWVVAAASVLVWRVGQPLWRSRRHQLVVQEVRAESDRVTTIVMRGRRLDRLPARAGQFFQWRFLVGSGYTRAHPYSLSAAPDGRTLRITVAHLGDGSASVTRLRPGTKVLFEGPYGRLHAGVRTRRKVLLLACGIGIMPMRALLEDLDQRPGEVTLVYRVRSEQECIMLNELNDLVGLREARFFVLTGHRVSARDSWLPEQSSHFGDVEALRQLVPDVAAHDVFVCGSIGWVAAAERAVLRAGVPRENVHIERFAN